MRLFFVMMAVLYSLYALGQDYYQFTISDGLPSNKIYGTLTDSDGFVWFYTDNGVAKYDGYGFKIFNKKDGLEDIDIWQMHEDMYGRKWLISSSVLGYYIRNDSVFVEDEIKPKFNLRPQEIQYIDQGLIYNYRDTLVIKASDQLLLINKEQWKSSPKLKNQLQSLELDSAVVQKVVDYLDRADIKYNLNINSFIAKFSLRTVGDYFEINTDELHFKVQDTASKFLLNHKGSPLEFDIASAGVEEIRAINIVNDTIIIHHKKGQLKIDLDQERIVSNHLIVDIDFRLTRTMVNDRYLISGSDDNGVIFGSPDPAIPRYLTEKSIEKIGLTDDHGMIFTTKENSEYRLSVSSGDWSDSLKYKDHVQPENLIKASKRLYLLYDLSIVDLSANQVLYKDQSGLRFQDNPLYKDLYLSNSSDLIDTDSFLLVLRYDMLYFFKNGNFREFKFRQVGTDIYCIEYFKDHIYIGTGRGAFVYHEDESITKHVFDSISPVNVSNMLNVNDDKLAIVSDLTQLNFWDAEHYIKIANFDSPIRELCSGGAYLYGLTGDNLFRVDLQSYEVQKFYFQSISGLGKIISIESTMDTIYMGTEQGYYRLHHDALRPVTHVPKIITLEVSNQDGIIPTSELASICTSKNNLRFDFKALSIISMGNIEYSYRLLPSVSNWKSTESLYAEYSSLSANEHIFEVYATDAFGNKSAISSLEFQVVRPWYESKKFYVFLSLILIGMVWLFFRDRIANIQEQEQQKTRINQKIARYELQALRAQMNPHFIFNVLSSIQNAIRNQDVETADDHLHNFATLIRKYLEFSEKRFLSLQEEIELVKLYAEIENLRFDPKIDITFEIDPKLDCEIIRIPSMLIQPIVENAINHGLFYKKSGRKLKLSFHGENDDLSILIEDNGIGREKSRKNKRSFETKRVSKGLLNIRNRIEILNESEEVKIKYHIEDIKDSDGMGIGTRVRLLIMNNDIKSRNR